MMPGKKLDIADVFAHDDRPMNPFYHEFTFRNGDRCAHPFAWVGVFISICVVMSVVASMCMYVCQRDFS